MQRFRAGPPGGRALALVPARLADLAGGAYGPGASAARSGAGAAAKAAAALRAGETWGDLREYYVVRRLASLRCRG
jgi:SEL1 protein